MRKIKRIASYDLDVIDFPKMEVGDELRFSYPIAMGVHPCDNWGENYSYVWCDTYDFSHIKRYKIPADETLIDGLWRYVNTNMLLAENGDCGTSCKVWIYRTKKGYEVDLP